MKQFVLHSKTKHYLRVSDKRLCRESSLRALAAGLLLFAPLLQVGCHWRSRQCSNCGEGAIGAPLGTYFDQRQLEQQAQGDINRRVVYVGSWLGETDELGPATQRHIAQWVSEQNASPADNFLWLEPSGNSSLDQQRQLKLVSSLSAFGYELGPESIPIGYPSGNSITGQEATRLVEQMEGGEVADRIRSRLPDRSQNVGTPGN